MTAYAFPNAWELARRRVELLEAAHDPTSFRRAEALGVGPGWDCLEVGAGGGSFTRWLAERVGPSGSVLAVDIDTRLVEEIDAPGLEIHEMNVETDELPSAAFDLVHTRLLLLHVPQRDAVLQKLARALRPGGLLLIEEDDIYPVRALEEGPYRDAWDAFLTVTDRAGVDPTWARDLPQRLTRLGLLDVDAEVDTQLFRGGSAAAQMWNLTWLQARPDAADQDAIDRGRAMLEEPARWFYGPARIMAWGRRPGALRGT
ncbi:MAG TPA: methyltransferase domain-containing protein [Solirubrobacteraceae bacterium]|nr:methyltransferase domain-containing protein [Solirubrobacteraceae bacterium]